MITVVSVFTVTTAAILFTFMVKDFLTGVKVQAAEDPHPLRVLITGHQWWWEVQYENENASQIIKTANEIHLPVGKAVQFDLESADVIHSFWSPNFAGKKDIIPGHPTSLWFRPTQTGTFFGQCAEFCGLQHAHMRFTVVVQTDGEFQQWLKAQSEDGHSPTNDIQRRGEAVFMNGNCIMCHTVSGTPARGTIGPNLTHVASQKMIAAGTLPNTIGHMGGWVLDSQQIKPGVLMPQNNLTPADFQALLAYLENLN
jgi:cytochrome c oxidase subunit 2